jgi:hypothetical protein
MQLARSQRLKVGAPSLPKIHLIDAWLRRQKAEPIVVGDPNVEVHHLPSPRRNSKLSRYFHDCDNEIMLLHEQKKFSEFCGNARAVPARSTLEDPGVLIPQEFPIHIDVGFLFLISKFCERTPGAVTDPKLPRDLNPPAPARGRHRDSAGSDSKRFCLKRRLRAAGRLLPLLSVQSLLQPI